MDDNTLRDIRDKYEKFFLSRMKNGKLASGGKFVQCRCPVCGDSIHQQSAHLYIQLPDGEKPSWFYCHKCHATNTITYKTLLEWDIYDKDMADTIEYYNNLVRYNPKSRKFFSTPKFFLTNNQITKDNNSENKRQYIYKRIGVLLSYEEISNLKICLNLLDLIRENHIEDRSRQPNIICDLDREFIGFISVDNSYLNMRRICPPGQVYSIIDKRYINFKLYNKFDNTKRFYTIPTNINLNTPNRIKLHIAEGPFDILSIYFNCRQQENGIYTAVGGSNYINVINYFLVDLMLPYIELHLYPDNDKYGNMETMKRLKKKMLDKNIPMFIHKNVYPNEKDFGVPVNKIKETMIQIN